MKEDLKNNHLKSADKILSKESLGNFESKISELKEYYQIEDSKSFEQRTNNQKLDHDEKDHKLKLNIASFLKWLLLIQSTTIFALVFLQGFKFLGFDLEDYNVLNILVAGVLTESYFLVRIIVEHLFPKKDDEREGLLKKIFDRIKN